MPAVPKLSAPRRLAAVPASWPWLLSASTCTHGNPNPQAAMKNQSGMAVPHSPTWAWSSTTITTEATNMTTVETARIHCGPTYFVRRDDDCTPMMMPMEFTAKSRPYSCALNL